MTVSASGVPTTLDTMCDAYELMHERGWIQGAYVDNQKRLCAASAVVAAIRQPDEITYSAVTPKTLRGFELRKYRAALHALIIRAGSLPNWTAPRTLEEANNDACQTFAHVCNWFERAIIHEARASEQAKIFASA